ncbi:MAG: circadian clock protein KaiA [Pleurocapsa sp. MO_192.B19]|nr:circadian clock protein KaiA [Pleurocapsa sp. MO_192.B19]
MSDHQDKDFRASECSVSSKLHICLFSTQQQFAQSVIKFLSGDRYELKCLSLTQELVDLITNSQEQIDCLVFVNDAQLSSALEKLWQSEILLPTVIVEVEQPTNMVASVEQNLSSSLTVPSAHTLYHRAEIHLYPTQIAEINSYINLAINKFLSLPPNSHVTSHQPKNKSEQKEQKEGVGNSLILQQRRLIGKLKERLGYLGVYYKRNSGDFYRNLPSEKQERLYQKLSQSYRKVLLNYFTNNSETNKIIDEFVDQAFFADVSTSQILEIHMELIDEFSHQLQIEGRNEDILLDYRLALIDIIAHLCEMYRRSIPGEDISLELLFRVE